MKADFLQDYPNLLHRSPQNLSPSSFSFLDQNEQFFSNKKSPTHSRNAPILRENSSFLSREGS